MNKLKLHKSIYTCEDILNVSNAFIEICKISIQNYNDYWLLVFTDCVTDEKTVINEFENYLIDYIGTKQ